MAVKQEKIGDNFEAELEAKAIEFVENKLIVDTLEMDPAYEARDTAAAELRKLVDLGFSASDEITVTGVVVPLGKKKARDFSVKVGATPEKRELVDLKAVAEMLGDDFWNIATVSLTNLDKYLTPEQVAQVTKSERIGTRRVIAKVAE